MRRKNLDNPVRFDSVRNLKYSCSQMLSCVVFFYFIFLFLILRPKVVPKGEICWNISKVLAVLCHCFCKGDFCLNFSNLLIFMLKFSE